MNNLTTDNKSQIQADLRAFVDNLHEGSANKASRELDVSNATVSNMLKGGDRWASISDDMWRRVQKRVSVNDHEKWKVVETQTLREFRQVFEDAGNHAQVFGLTAFAGSGKTQTAKYMRSQRNFFLVRCADYFTRKTFLEAVLRAMGRPYSGYSVHEMMMNIIDHLESLESPVLVLDEADKLSDSVLSFFIVFYNDLEDSCGIILMATDYLAKRIKRGVASQKKGYEEIFSRLGRKFIEVQPPTSDDMERIIKANGITDQLMINDIINQSDGDLRRVKKLVFAFKQEVA